MTTLNELRSGLMSLAKRAVSMMPACSNEESTRLHLVMPFLRLLGYDTSDPREVYPGHAADFGAATRTSIDLAIFRNGVARIGVAARRVGAEIEDSRSQLAAYFNALATVKLGIVTNGVVYAFFVDSMVPDVMDDEPFLTIDLETIAGSGLADEELLEALLSVTKAHFAPAAMAETAHVRLVRRRLRKVFLAEARSPSEAFCRLALERIGIAGLSAATIERHYAPLVHAAFEEALVLPVVRQLKADRDAQSRNFAANLAQTAQRVITAEREIAIFAYVRRRLAFLIADEAQFNAIEGLGYKDFLGKLTVYYDAPAKGRLFDFIEGADGYDKFIFPEPFGEIVTNNIYEIDEALRATFVSRVKEFGAAGLTQRLARIA